MLEVLKKYYIDKQLHHFYLLEGESQEIESDLQTFLTEEVGIDCRDVSLFYRYHFNQFLVKEARNILLKSQIKTPTNKRMVFLIFANSITPQSQNALLKLLEEPSNRTYFFIVLPRLDNLLPTLISRAVVIKKEQVLNSKRKNKNVLLNLRQMPVAERLTFVNNLTSDIKNKKTEKIEAQKFVRDLIIDLEKEVDSYRENHIIGSIEKNYVEKIRTLMKIDDYLNDSGASIKILLERAVLVL